MMRRAQLNGRLPCPICGHVAPRNGLHRVCCDCEIETLYANWLRRLDHVKDYCRLWRELTRRGRRSVPLCWPYPAFLTGPVMPEVVKTKRRKRRRRRRRCPVCGAEAMMTPQTVFGQPYTRRGGSLLRCASCETLVGTWHFGRPRRTAVAAVPVGPADDSGPETYAQQSEQTAFYSGDDRDAAVWEHGITEHQTASANGRPSNVDGRLPTAERAKLREEIIYFQKCRRLHPRATELFDRRRR
jgi:hypothetical protein